METHCPQCGTQYPITAAHIGRKLTCKQCLTPLIVAESGLAYRTEPSAPKPAYAPPPPAPEPAYVSDVEVDEPEDLDERGPRRSRGRRRSSGGGGFMDILTFRKMVIPFITQLMFWIATITFLVLGVAGFLVGLVSGRLETIAAGLVFLILLVPSYILLFRMYCEIVIVIFRINETLIDIRNELRSQRR